MTHYDAIVVGGGPAGVIAAVTIVQRSLTVLLLDKKAISQIGDKNCGDALDPRTPKLLAEELDIDVPHEDEISDEIKAIQIGTKTDTISRATVGYVVD